MISHSRLRNRKPTLPPAPILFLGRYQSNYSGSPMQCAQVVRLQKPLAMPFTVSPDEKWLAYAQPDSSLDDWMLAERISGDRPLP